MFASLSPACVSRSTLRAVRRAGNWLAAAADSRSARRRLNALLRLACRSLGPKRAKGFGMLAIVGLALGGIAIATGGARADYVAGSGTLGDSKWNRIVIGAGDCTDAIAVVVAGAAPVVKGISSIAIGGCSGHGHPGTEADGEDAIAIGRGTVARGINATALGRAANALADNSLAVGAGAKASEADATAIGKDAKASVRGAVAIGGATTADVSGKTVTRAGAEASAQNGIAIGSGASATQTTDRAAIAIGEGAKAVVEAKATGEDASATRTTDRAAIAIGEGATVFVKVKDASLLEIIARSAIAIGEGAKAINAGVAMGFEADAAMTATAVGSSAKASGFAATAVGPSANASHDVASAFGFLATASHTAAVAIGAESAALEGGAIAIGSFAIASSHSGLALGTLAKATHANSVALGSFAATEPLAEPAAPVPLNGKDYTLQYPKTVGVVSLGTAAYKAPKLNTNGERIRDASGNQQMEEQPAETRRMIYLAPGRVKAGSTDAVNGDQLYAAYEGINDLGRTSVQYTPTDTNNDGKIDGTDKLGAKLVLKDTVISKVAAGDVSKASTDAVNGRQLHGLDRRSLKYHWNDKNNDGILDEGEIETATLKLEANSAEGITIIGTKLDNVADGAINAASLEAINGRQMHKSVNSVADAIGGGALTVNGIVSSPGFDIADYTGRGGSSHRYGNVGDALDQLSRNDTAFDKRFGELASKVGDLGQRSLQLNRQRKAYDAAGPAVAEDQARAQATAGQAKAARILVAEPQVRGVAPASADMVPEAMGPETASLVPSESIALPAGLAGADPAATPPVEAAPSAGLKPIINVGDGRVVTGSSDVVTGGQLKTVDDKVERLASQVGTGLSPETAKKVDDLEQRSVSYEAIEGKKTNKVQLAGGDPNAPVVIANLGDGVADTDGVNVRQLKGLKAKVDAVAEPAEKLTELTNSMDKVGNNAVKNAKAYTDVAVDTAHSRMNEIGSTALSTAKTYTDDAMDTANSRMNEVGSSTLSKANAYTDDAIDMANGRIDEIGSTMTKGFKQLNSDVTELREGFKQLNSDIASVRKEARQAAAIGLAASSLRFDGTPGKVSVAVGGGAWRDASAFAFGAGYTSETGKVRANITGVTSGGQVGVGAGLSITLN